MSLKYFTDRDLGRRFPEILVAAGLSVERHDDRFPQACLDEEWLEYVGSQGLVAITHDGRIRYKPNELAAVKRHRVALLVVVGKAPLPVLARHFVNTLPRISTFVLHHEVPFIAKVHRPSTAEADRDPAAQGTVSQWFPQ